jgi:hypothetical protein
MVFNVENSTELYCLSSLTAKTFPLPLKTKQTTEHIFANSVEQNGKAQSVRSEC